MKKPYTRKAIRGSVRKPTVKQLAATVKTVKQLKSNVEKKYVQNATTSGLNIYYDTDNATDIFALTSGGISSGVESNERIGDWITPTSLNGTVQVRQSFTSGQENRYRIMLLQCKQRFVPNTVSTGSASSSAVLRLQNGLQTFINPFFRPNRTHFTVLYDSGPMRLGVDNAEGGSPHSRFHKIKCKPRKIKFEADSNSLEKGALYLCAWSDRATAETVLAPVIYTSWEMFYTDS